MTSVLESIQHGRQPKPPRVLLYGVEGIGKSTFGSEAPQPIFVQTEDGLDEIDCDRFPLATKFDDVIAWRSGYLDIGFVRLSKMKVHDVPYRSILPEKVDGLLTAGRCISATHVAASAGKSMGNCVATGHAAGLAAALSVERNQQPRELNVADIQDALRKDGVDLDMGGKNQEDVTLDRKVDGCRPARHLGQ